MSNEHRRTRGNRGYCPRVALERRWSCGCSVDVRAADRWAVTGSLRSWRRCSIDGCVHCRVAGRGSRRTDRMERMDERSNHHERVKVSESAIKWELSLFIKHSSHDAEISVRANLKDQASRLDTAANRNSHESTAGYDAWHADPQVGSRWN
jgi:hypothetical protein